MAAIGSGAFCADNTLGTWKLNPEKSKPAAGQSPITTPPHHCFAGINSAIRCFEDLVFALVGLRYRLIVFIRREPDDCRFTILELTDAFLRLSCLHGA
jgi:hypothetical protein